MSGEAFDLNAACALASAIEGLATAGVVSSVIRPIASELRAILEAARGNVASVVDLKSARSSRER